MRPAIALLGLGLLAGSTGVAGDRDFDAIVRGMESHYGVRRMAIPLFGVANFFVKIARPAGASDVKLAIFEDVDGRRHPSDEALESMFASLPGQGWRSFVRVHSRRDGERVHIFSRRVHDKWELLITTLERDETIVMKVRLNPDGLAKWIDNPGLMARSNGNP